VIPLFPFFLEIESFFKCNSVRDLDPKKSLCQVQATPLRSKADYERALAGHRNTDAVKWQFIYDRHDYLSQAIEDFNDRDIEPSVLQNVCQSLAHHYVLLNMLILTPLNRTSIIR